MSVLVDLFSGGGIGTALSSITGLVGGYLAKREARFITIETNKHEATMADLDMQADKLQLQAAIQMADKQMQMAQTEGEIAQDLVQSESEAAVNQIDAKGFADAMAQANKPTGFDFVDKFRALTRPLLTWIMFIFVMVIFAFLHKEVGQLVAEDKNFLSDLYVYLVQSIIYLFIMAISWWFMSRGEKSAQQIKSLFNK